MKDLHYLNLTGTNISAEGLTRLSNLDHLQSIYISNTQVNQEDLAILEASFPSANLEFANYSFEAIDSLDSTVQ